MGSLNRVTLIGHLGKDAESRYTAGGTCVANFSLATTESWKGSDGQRQEKTEWHRCSLWGKRAEALAQYLQKGKQIYLEGRLETRKYQDRSGADRWITEIKVLDVVLLGSGGGGRRERAEPSQAPAEAPADSDFGAEPAAGWAPEPAEEDIPF